MHGAGVRLIRVRLGLARLRGNGHHDILSWDRRYRVLPSSGPDATVSTDLGPYREVPVRRTSGSQATGRWRRTAVCTG
ncbi:hypothetical protein C731_0772 [Mycolicibacterium hassiacum DSM 44199]|uniref:Uncharacterized protein n=1 Tax=Mycolicibacterium hassiacum (strain DSM 44199 / CIP 105218 / JCM 12690 / 3849) TaxID=1122247 RepID=K5BCJ4_MYCHD|nr:hypothetical protein C731_0772 [Mycolicibacterium hassiacum DSM 44199]